MPFLPRPLLQAACVCVSLSLAPALWAEPPAAAAATAAPSAATQPASKLEELKNTILQLKQELEAAKNNRQGLQKDLESSEKKISELNQKVEELKKQLGSQHSQLQHLHSEQEALASAKKHQQRQVEQHLVAAYRLGSHSGLKLLFSQQDPSQLARATQYFRYTIKARQDSLSEFNRTLARLAALEPEITAQTQALEAQQRQLNTQITALEAQAERRRRTLVQLEASLSSTDQQLAAAENNRKQLEALLKKVVKTAKKYQAPPEAPTQPAPPAATANPLPSTNPSPTIALRKGGFGQQKGLLPWPTEGTLLYSFGASKNKGALTWEGLYIQGAAGQPVRAIYKGRVLFANYLRGQGLLLVIDHGNGYWSLYAHNQTLYKKEGDLVDTGQTIASLGNTGGQARYGLYFELRYQQQPTNPKVWLKPKNLS